MKNHFANGKILKNGISTAIVGKPNVGKSSLLNLLLDEERAIVTDIPGTTRDTIEEYINLSGVSLKLVDTAGIRETNDVVENIGVEKSKKAIENAELVLFLIDASTGASAEDLRLYEEIKKKPHIVILNKIDLKEATVAINDENMVKISAKTGAGLEELSKKIEGMFSLNQIGADDSIVITNIRHKDLISKAIAGIKSARDAVIGGIPVDMISINIQDAINSLGEILGESISEDVLNRIFEKFCVGK